MSRPRIEGIEERIIKSFIERGIYKNQKEVLSAALKALTREQVQKEAKEREELPFNEALYASQLGDR